MARLRGERGAALEYALGNSPDRIGVGRLCQELLADVTGREVTFKPERPVRLDDRCREVVS